MALAAGRAGAYPSGVKLLLLAVSLFAAPPACVQKDSVTPREGLCCRGLAALAEPDKDLICRDPGEVVKRRLDVLDGVDCAGWAAARADLGYPLVENEERDLRRVIHALEERVADGDEELTRYLIKAGTPEPTGLTERSAAVRETRGYRRAANILVDDVVSDSLHRKMTPLTLPEGRYGLQKRKTALCAELQKIGTLILAGQAVPEPSESSFP